MIVFPLCLMCPGLCELLKSGTQSVQEESLGSVACVAAVVEADFGKYYDYFMPGIKTILSGSVTKENRSLRAKAGCNRPPAPLSCRAGRSLCAPPPPH